MIASIWGRESGGRMTYNAVKAAEISLAKSLAQQLAPVNIRVNSVAPGSILFPGGSWHKRQQADPAGHRRVRQARAAVRPLRPRRRSRRRRRVPRLAARQLDQRRVDRRRRLPGHGRISEHLMSRIRYIGVDRTLPITESPRSSRTRQIPSIQSARRLRCSCRGSSCVLLGARALFLTLRHRVRAGPAVRRGVARRVRRGARSGGDGRADAVPGVHDRAGRVDRHRQHRRRGDGDRLGRSRRAVLDLGVRLRRDGDQVRARRCSA